MSKQINIGERISALELKYGKKKLAKKLGITTRTLYNYKNSITQPKTKMRTKINSMFRYAATTQIKTRYMSIQEYLYKSPIREFYGTKNLQDAYLALADQGYIVAWQGTAKPPLEVRLTLGKENINSISSNTLVILAIVTNAYITSLDKESNFKNKLIYPGIRIPLLAKKKEWRKQFEEADFETRNDILRQNFEERYNGEVQEKEMPTAYLGYYFEE